MKHLKLFEELTFSQKRYSIQRRRGRTILYSLIMMSIVFLWEFTKCYLLDNTISMEIVDDYLSELWEEIL
jgi:hypothetical protein